jgi:hypothetical protein
MVFVLSDLQCNHVQVTLNELVLNPNFLLYKNRNEHFISERNIEFESIVKQSKWSDK